MIFQYFSKNKANYNKKGQVFPFLIGVICVIIILTMVTVNLGQIGIFKTDVSNAADSAALAGASVLSGTLLGLGLKSDMMAGYGIVSWIFITGLLCYGKSTNYNNSNDNDSSENECKPYDAIKNFVTAIIMWIAALIHQLVEYYMAVDEAEMGWANARRTAVQYVFNNVGVDEARPTFAEFLKGAYGISDTSSLSASQVHAYYNEYLKGETANSRRHARSNFSRFMEDNKNGYWKESTFGKIAPGEKSQKYILSGYGWSKGNRNSYCPQGGCDTDYNNYENYVEAKVNGKGYSLDPYFIPDSPMLAMLGAATAVVWVCSFFKFCKGWWGALIATIVAAIYLILMSVLPIGLKFISEAFETDANPIQVKVARFRGPSDLGLWKFRYGTITAGSQAHAYRETGKETIKPALAKSIALLFNSGFTDWDWSWFDTRIHLFETKLMYSN